MKIQRIATSERLFLIRNLNGKKMDFSYTSQAGVTWLHDAIDQLVFSQTLEPIEVEVINSIPLAYWIDRLQAFIELNLSMQNAEKPIQSWEYQDLLSKIENR